jgi:hypothetical protein
LAAASVFHWVRVSVPYQGPGAAAAMLGMVFPSQEPSFFESHRRA